MPVLLQVEELRTQFATSVGAARAVDCIAHTVDEGETVGIVGGSGCGKSVGALSILRLIADPHGSSASGAIGFAGRDLLTPSDEAIRALRGGEISMVSMVSLAPMTTLNPVLTIGQPLCEGMELHLKLRPDDAKARAIALLERVGISEAERRLQPTVPTLSERRRAPTRADCARAHFYYLLCDEAVPARPAGGRQLATGSSAADGIEARVLGRLSTRVESVGTGFMGA